MAVRETGWCTESASRRYTEQSCHLPDVHGGKRDRVSAGGGVPGGVERSWTREIPGRVKAASPALLVRFNALLGRLYAQGRCAYRFLRPRNIRVAQAYTNVRVRDPRGGLSGRWRQHIATAPGLGKEFDEPLLLGRDDEGMDERGFMFDEGSHRRTQSSICYLRGAGTVSRGSERPWTREVLGKVEALSLEAPAATLRGQSAAHWSTFSRQAISESGAPS